MPLPLQAAFRELGSRCYFFVGHFANFQWAIARAPSSIGCNGQQSLQPMESCRIASAKPARLSAAQQVAVHFLEKDLYNVQ